MSSILVACGQVDTDTTGLVIEPSTSQTQHETVTTFPATSLEEWKSKKIISTGSLAGPLVINFWASWCTPCREEMPLLQSSFTPEEIIGVNASDAGQSSYAREAADSVLTQAAVQYPIYVDQEDQLVRALGISAFPVTIVIDGKGNIVKRIDGPLGRKDVTALRKVLAANK